MTSRRRNVILIVIAILLGLSAKSFNVAKKRPDDVVSDYRLPIETPVLEQDRPDLIGEFGIEEHGDPN